MPTPEKISPENAPTELAAAEPCKSRTGRYLFLTCMAAVLLLCGGPLSWWFGRHAIANRRFQEQKADLVARDLPIDNASLAVYRERMMDKSKSERWVQILETVESEPFNQSATHLPIIGVPEDEQPFVPGQPWAHAEDVAEFLEQWSSLRKDIHEVTEQTESIWTYTEFDSFSTLLPYIQSTRSVARLLTLEHLDALRRNDREQAYHSLLGLIGVARAIETEPLMVSQLVHLATLGVAQQQLKLSLEADMLDDQQLHTILNQLQQIPPFGDRFRWAIYGERAMVLPAFENPSSLDDSLPATGARPIDALAALEVYAGMEAIDTDSLESFMADTMGVEQNFTQRQEQAGLLRKYDTLLTNLVVPALGAVSTAYTRLEMQTRIAKTAIGLRLYEHRFDRWPLSLDELSQLDTDLGSLQPLGPQPFGFRIVDGEAVLWGFDIHSGATQVPNEPIDLDTLEEYERDSLEYWLWRLKRAE